MIKLQHDLVDKCQPGDEVVVVGSLLAQWQLSLQPEVDCKIGMALNAHSIRVVQENGSSAWKSAGANTSVGELEKFRKEFDTYWEDANNQSQPIAARDFICKAVCPKLYGLQVIKLSLLITLIGGVSSDVCAKEKLQDAGSPSTPTGPLHDQANTPENHHAPEPFRMIENEATPTQTLYYERKTKQQGNQQAVQTRRRDMSHMLLVGDPGTGKSQFLRFAAALCPRSVLTTGVGTTSAGLTCAAVRDGSGGEFSLEAGALVLADKGVCCIDEFGCIKNEDRTTIHEAMEQQTLSVAKAGIVCKLNCRATVIAVMNPRDCIYDNHASLSTNTGLGTPLLSRFDLIFKLVDTSDAERDSNVTTYLLNRAIQGSGFECSNAGTGIAQELPWTMEKLRAYISIVKERFQPIISDEAATLLESHYEKIRSAHSSVIPVTVRFLESLIRLSQAHARLMYHNIVTLEDAVAVLRVMECSAFAYGGFNGDVDDVENILYCDPMTIDVSNQEPDEDFIVFEYQILVRYGMLEHLSEDVQQRALQLLNGGGDEEDIMGYGAPAMALGAGGWQELENPRDKQSSIVHDHYGRSYFSPPNSSQGSARKRRRR
jgi:DNA replicative helicase MCM subunit Mcm2 (Cdc46/Mcm family)